MVHLSNNSHPSTMPCILIDELTLGVLVVVINALYTSLFPKNKVKEMNRKHQQSTTAVVVVCLGICGVYVNPSLVDGGILVQNKSSTC